MKEITVTTIKEGTPIQLWIPSEWNAQIFRQWQKTDGYFRIRPVKRQTKQQVKYLEGAVIPCWGKYQYGIDPRNHEMAETARTLFKQDFNHIIIKDVKGNPRRVAQSLKGKHIEVLDKYTEYAKENGYPIPNEDLYKLWRDKYSMDLRWISYWDWLEAVGLEVDTMPSDQTIKRLDEI